MSKKVTKTILGRGKRLGRGYGSGKGGHTVGKGQKGQKTRKRLGILFEGVKVKKSLIKRLPFLRGKGRFKSGLKPVVINIERLNDFPAGTKIDIKYLFEKKVVTKKEAEERGVKVLGNTDVKKKFLIDLPISKAASEKIVKAGGKILTASER